MPLVSFVGERLHSRAFPSRVSIGPVGVPARPHDSYGVVLFGASGAMGEGGSYWLTGAEELLGQQGFAPMISCCVEWLGLAFVAERTVEEINLANEGATTCR